MKVKDMNNMQLTEMTMRWDIEYEQSYLYSLEDGHIQYAADTSELEMLRDHEDATRRVYEAKHRYDEFMTANAEHFI